MLATGLGSVLWACGPFFPNSLLLEGDRAVLQAPEVRFRHELDRLPLEPPPGCIHHATDASEREATLAAEILDLRQALGATLRDTNRVAEVLLAFSRRRADLEDHRQALERWRDDAAAEERRARRSVDAPGTEIAPAEAPVLEDAELPAEVPREFALYLAGARAWHERDTNAARAVWESILKLLPKDRRFKSTWASFMLGRSWHEEDPGKAARHYQATRTLARSGWSDSASLAVASLGWEGQLMLRTNKLGPALHLYLDQYAAGSTHSAGLSLEVAAQRVAEAPDDLRSSVARDPVARRVVTAWLLASTSARWDSGGSPEDMGPVQTVVTNWLETLESSGAAEVPLAEQLALLTYRQGEWETAARWIELSGDSPVAEWIHAKLLLREGKLDESAAAFSRVLARLPVEPPKLEPGEPPPFVDSLSDARDGVPARRMVLAESGVLHLTRGEFVQALDALLRAGYWTDAAYVAERVLTLPELRSYVDAHWPEDSSRKPAAEDTELNSPDTERGQRERIRYLLGRRLTRSNLGLAATPYYPTTVRPTHREFLTRLAQGEDASRPPLERARGFFAAAGIARTNGLEILGTEVAPDWAIWYGQHEYGPTSAERNGASVRHLRPTPEEPRRYARHTADPEQRFHYRYQAAFLAWDAAQWMPDNDPETALMLYTAGSWLKARDPKTADLFYKALVRRCRATELGDAADRQRWFPALDATGKPILTRDARRESPHPRKADLAPELPDPALPVLELEDSGPFLLEYPSETPEPEVPEPAEPTDPE